MSDSMCIKKDYKLPNHLKGRSIHSKVIPTVCNLKNMLNKLVKVNGDFSQLKQWEKRSYKAYNIDEIKNEILPNLPPSRSRAGSTNSGRFAQHEIAGDLNGSTHSDS